MNTFSLDEANVHLSGLVERAAAGEEVILSRDGVPGAKLVPLPETKEPRRPAGTPGITYLAPDFDRPDPEIVDLFGARD